MVGCLSTEQLEHYAGGATAELDARQIKTHLEHCPSCRDGLEACRANLAYLEEVREHLEQTNGSSGTDTVTADQVSRPHPPTAAQPPPEADSIPGYRILGEIHRGGQGVVYEAVQLSTKRTVAVKLLLEGPFASTATRWRFQREVELIAALRHPNIVVIHDSGIAAGKYFFAMDLVHGKPLDAHFESAGNSPRDVMPLFIQVCEAIAFAHRRGVMHRDLKPSNILVSEEGTPCVLDFGLAKIVGGEANTTPDRAATMAGRVMGTLPYMSPEQTVGDPDAVDIRTDVYSLGIILYDLLTGSAPYHTGSDLMESIRNIREAVPPRPSKLTRKVDSDLESIITKAIEKEPQRRYQSAGELGQDLTAWLERRPVSARSASSLYLLRKLAVRHRYAATAVTALVVAIIAFSLISFDFYLQARRAQDGQGLSDQASTQLLQDLDELGTTTLPALRRQALGWFLDAWHGGRVDEAKGIQVRLENTSPEYAAMAFLLDDSYGLDQLLADLPAKNKALAYFVAGVRAAEAQQTDDAIDALGKCLEFGADAWLASSAKARLANLRSTYGGGELAGASP